MSAISQKSISGITSITTPAGVDNVFTVHTNDTTERFRVDSTGSLNIAGISTFNGVIDAIGNIQIRNSAPILKFSETDNTKDFFIVGDSNKLSIRKNTTAGGNVVQEWMDNSVLFRENVDIDADIDVDGHTELDNVNISGVSTYAGQARFNGELVGSIISVSNSININDKLIHSGDTDTAIRFPAADTISFETAGSERLRTLPGGEVYVGLQSFYASHPEFAVNVGPSNLHGVTIHSDTAENDGDLAGLAFSHGSNGVNVARSKAAIGFRCDNSGYGRGDLCFYVDGTADNNSVAAADERLRITSDGKVGINTSSLNQIFEVNALGNDANNFQQIVFEKKSSANNKQAFGLIIRSNAQTSSGNEPTAYLRFDARPSSLNGSHGGNAIIAFSPIGVTQGTYGKGNLDFYLRSGGTYTFQNDPGGVGEMQPKLRIDSSGRVMIGTTTEGFATYGDQFTIANGGHCGMTIRSGTSNYGTIYFSDADDGSADEVRGFIDYNHSNNQLQIGTNAATKLRISSEGWVTKPEHPAFFATHTGTDGSTSNGDLIQLTSTRHNKGDCYSTSNYYFTAPVAGVYHFTGQVWAKNGSSNARWQFSYYNGSSWSSITQHGWHGNSVNKNDFMQNASITYYMNSGDRMGMRVDGSTLSYYRGGGGAAHTYFCGHLVG